MAARKTPILLRPAPLSGEVMALYRYRTTTINGRELIDCGYDGRQPVAADFDAIVMQLLLDPAPDICAALDGAARGMTLDESEREQISLFRSALVTLIKRHNARLKGKDTNG